MADYVNNNSEDGVHSALTRSQDIIELLRHLLALSPHERRLSEQEIG